MEFLACTDKRDRVLVAHPRYVDVIYFKPIKISMNLFNIHILFAITLESNFGHASGSRQNYILIVIPCLIYFRIYARQLSLGHNIVSLLWSVSSDLY